MQVIGFGGRSVLIAMAMQELGRLVTIRRPSAVIVIDECAHLPSMHMLAQPVEESPHPGERHRDNVKRVNSGRSRAGKAARWA